MSFLSPIVSATYDYPSLGWGWPSYVPGPVYINPYPSFSPSLGGRYFYGSYFSPAYAGVSFWPSYPGSYSYDVMDAGFRLLNWGNIIEADPFYRAWYGPFFFPPLYIPPPVWPSWPSYQPASYNAAPAASAPVNRPAGGQNADRSPPSETQRALTEAADKLEKREEELREKVKQEEERLENLAREREEELEGRRKEIEREQQRTSQRGGGRAGRRSTGGNNSSEIRVAKHAEHNGGVIYSIVGKNSHIFVDQKGEIYEAQFRSGKMTKGKKMEGYRLDPTGQKLVKG